jgi:hypothetical protein
MGKYNAILLKDEFYNFIIFLPIRRCRIDDVLSSLSPLPIAKSGKNGSTVRIVWARRDGFIVIGFEFSECFQAEECNEMKGFEAL